MEKDKELHEKWVNIKAGITSKDRNLIKEHLKEGRAEYELISLFVVEPRDWISELKAIGLSG